MMIDLQNNCDVSLLQLVQGRDK